MNRWIATLATLALASTPTLAQEDLTLRELLALSARGANRQAQRDLLSILKPEGMYQKGMLRGVRGFNFTTTAHGTEYEGLCSRDIMTLWYARTDSGGARADIPMRPYRVSAGQEFHFLKPPTREPGSSTVWQDACVAAGDNPKTEWFSAPSEEAAVRGALLYRAALAAIKAGSVKPTCEGGSAKPGECAGWILDGADPDAPPSIEECSPVEGKLCIVFGAWSGMQLTIQAERNGDVLTPGTILSVDAVEFIIVT